MNIIHDKLHDTAPMPLCWSSEKPFILNAKGKFRKTTGNWMFNHFGPFFSGFYPYTLFHSWYRHSIFRVLNTECLAKIWSHSAKWFWSYVNLFFFLLLFFSRIVGILELGRRLWREKNKTCIFKDLDGPISMKSSKLLYFRTVYTAI